MFSYEAATSRIGQGIGNSCAFVWRWRGSIYQMLWMHFVVYFIISVVLGVIYRYALNETQQEFFDNFATYCKKHAESTVLTLMLSFFTGGVMNRWASIYQDIPSTTPVIRCAVLLFAGNEKAMKSCHAFTRYILLTWFLCMRSVSGKLSSAYPTLDSLIPLGFLKSNEKERLEEAIKQGFPAYAVSLSWSMKLIQKSKEDGLFGSPQDAGKLADAVMSFEKSCVKVLKFQEASMPLPFIQVVIISVYLYGVTNLLGSQFAPSETLLRGFFPFLPSFKFFGFLIWLRMGQIFLDPFGKDETDLDTNAVEVLSNSDSQDVDEVVGEAMEESRHVLFAVANLQLLNSIDEVKTVTA